MYQKFIFLDHLNDSNNPDYGEDGVEAPNDEDKVVGEVDQNKGNVVGDNGNDGSPHSKTGLKHVTGLCVCMLCHSRIQRVKNRLFGVFKNYEANCCISFF